MSEVDPVLDRNIFSNKQRHDRLKSDLEDLSERTSEEFTRSLPTEN